MRRQRLSAGLTTSLIGGLTVAAVLAGMSQASPALASDDSGLAATELTGQVVPVQARTAPDRDGPTQTLLRLPDGQLTPVDGIDNLASGATVHLTVDIPRALEDAVQDDVGRTALNDARQEPAAAASAVAQASTSAASSTGVALQTTSIDQVQPATAAPAPPAPPAPVAQAATAQAATAQAATAHGTAAQGTAAAAPAPQTLTIAAVSIGSYSAAGYTDEIVAGMVNSVSSYWSSQSNGAITFARSGPITSYSTSINCANASDLWNEGASKTGFTAGAGQHLVLLLPQKAYDAGACGTYGLGIVGSSVSSGGSVFVSDNSWPALAHELGHNMSLWHANELNCGTSIYDSVFTSSGDPSAAGCSVIEYGDRMDVMGSSAHDATGGLSSIGLARLGFMPAAQTRSVTALGATSVTVIPLSGGVTASGIRSVAVTDPRNSNVYYLEDRQYSGRDTYGWGGYGNQTFGGRTTGYGLRVLRRGLNGSSVVLDPTPSAAGSNDPDPSVRPGSTFLSASGGVQITTVQDSNGNVTASIDLAGTGQNHGTSTPSGNGGTASTETTTTLAAPARMLAGHSYTISGTVTGTGTPTGSVALQIGDDEQTLSLSASGTFSASYTPAEAGDVDISADYAGAEGFDESQDAVAVVVLAEKVDADIVITAPIARANASSARVDVTVTVDDDPLSGAVRITDASGTDIGGGTLNSVGRVRVSLPVPDPGQHGYRVVYAGNDIANSGSGDFTLTVAKYTSKVRSALARTTITRRSATSVTVAVDSAGDAAATGTVKLISGRDGVVSSAKLSGGKAKLTVPKGMTAGKQSLRVVYYGSASVATSTSGTMTLQVNR